MTVRHTLSQTVQLAKSQKSPRGSSERGAKPQRVYNPRSSLTERNRFVEDHTDALKPSRWDAVLAILALVIIAVLFVAPPHALLDKADHAAFAVCHRLPERSFAFAGRPLPLCARCSGTYLGALTGLLVLAARGRGRASRLPALRFLLVLGIFALAWAVDGANSFLTFFPGVSPLYEPRNILRLVTGTLEGLALAAILLPVLNLSLWSAPEPTPSIRTWRDLLWMLAGGAVMIVLVSSEWTPLLVPLALLSGLTIVALLGAVNTLLVLILLRRDGRGRYWREAFVPTLLGVMLALVEIAAIGLIRAALSAHLGLPI